MTDSDLAREKLFLQELARVGCMANQGFVVDGAALVARLSHENRACDVLVEVRLAGSLDELNQPEPSPHGRMLIFLQTVSDTPITLRAPEFLLTGGMTLPWKVGIVMMTNVFRGELAEALCWQVPLVEALPPEVLAADVVTILEKGKALVRGL
jgi:hypothetical protein